MRYYVRLKLFYYRSIEKINFYVYNQKFTLINVQGRKIDLGKNK